MKTTQGPKAFIFKWLYLIALLFILVCTGCATPISTNPVPVQQTYETISRNAVRNGTLSDLSVEVLHRFLLEEQFGESPEKAIAELHDIACRDKRRALLYTLAEMSYLAAGRGGNLVGHSETSARFYLMSAVYAYFYLFSYTDKNISGAYDRRLHFANEIYNAALSQFMERNPSFASKASMTYSLPVGSITIEIRQEAFSHPLDKIEAFIPADALSVQGLSVRNRLPGLGAPFVAAENVDDDRPVAKSHPGTLFLRVDGSVQDLAGGASAFFELYSSYEKRHIQVHGNSVPLEKDLSAQLAYNLNQEFFWNLGSLQFLGGEIVKSGVYKLQPYVPGRIPVVFVHGTFSTPARWAEMINTLRSDPVLWDKYQFWCYLYDSGKPIVLSTENLRNQLIQKKKELDPNNSDPALNEMIIIGHSQGGLLTKLTAVETGDEILRAVSGKSFDELELTPVEKELVQKYVIYTPLPFVRRVIFISTPHRGSYLATGWIRNLVQKVISLPVELMKKTEALAHAADDIGVTEISELGDLTTSIDNMSPENPGLLALADIPLADGIAGHSIIPIKGDDQPPEGYDGVVKYTSAHIDYAASELIVRDGHSCQSNPLVIEEVRRILIENLDESKITF